MAFDLSVFARQTWVWEPGEGPWSRAELDAEDAHYAWIMAGEPEVKGLSAEDAQALADRPLTVALAAKRERVDPRTIYRWLAPGGELHGCDGVSRAGTKWQITRAALDQRRVESAKPKAKVAKTRRSRRKPTPADSSTWFKA